MKYLLALILAVGVTLVACGQKVTLPAKVEVKPGRLATVTIDWVGDDLKWVAPEEVDVFREYDPDPKKVRLRLLGYTSGKFRLLAVAAKGGKLSEFAVCQIMVGDEPTPTPPGPTPPGPTPPGPTPTPAPIPVDGFRVLMLYESAEAAKYPASQVAALHSKMVRDYLREKCVKEDLGGWHIWDKDVDASAMPKHWQDALKRPRTELPWIIISTGKTGYEGPLPADADKTLELLKKYGG